MSYSRVYVRWARADVAIGAPGRELFVKASGIKDEEQARKLGEEVRAVANADVTTHTYSGEVRNHAQAPGGGWSIGDKMGGEVITGLNAKMGEDSSVVAPVLVDPDVLRQAALDRRLAALAQGGHSQWSSPASPKNPDPVGKDSGIAPWSANGPALHNTYSPLQRVKRPFHWAWLDIAVRIASDSHYGRDLYLIPYTLRRDGSHQTPLTPIGLPHGKTRAIVKMDVVVPMGRSVIFGLFLGGGNEDLSPAWTYRPIDLTVTAHGVVT